MSPKIRHLLDEDSTGNQSATSASRASRADGLQVRGRYLAHEQCAERPAGCSTIEEAIQHTGTSERVTQFTGVVVHARLIVPAAMDIALCERALQKAEHGCLVANSLRCERELRIEIVRTAVAQAESAVA